MRSKLYSPKRALVLLALCLPLSSSLRAQLVSTTTTLTLSPAAPSTNQTILLTAIISPAAAGNPSSNGVEFVYRLAGRTPQSAVVLPANGTAAITIGPLAAGTYTLQADYLGQPSSGQGGYASSHSTPISITVAPPSTGTAALSGHYAFLFQGTTSAASGSNLGVAAAGSFNADGNGTITSGILDFNTPSGVYELPAVSGTYALNATGRGTLTLTSAIGTQIFEISVPSGEATTTVQSAALTTNVGGIAFGKGHLARQSPTFFSQYYLAGIYDVDLLGEASPAENHALVLSTGQLTLGSDRTASSILDQAKGTAVSTGTAASGSYSVPDATTGRITLSTVDAEDSSKVHHFILYPIDATHLYLLSTDSHSNSQLISGTANQ